MKVLNFSRLRFVSALVLGIMVVFASASLTTIDANSAIGGGTCDCSGTQAGESCHDYNSKCSGSVTVCLTGSSGDCGCISGTNWSCSGASCPNYCDSQCTSS